MPSSGGGGGKPDGMKLPESLQTRGGGAEALMSSRAVLARSSSTMLARLLCRSRSPSSATLMPLSSSPPSPPPEPALSRALEKALTRLVNGTVDFLLSLMTVRRCLLRRSARTSAIRRKAKSRIVAPIPTATCVERPPRRPSGAISTGWGGAEGGVEGGIRVEGGGGGGDGGVPCEGGAAGGESGGSPNRGGGEGGGDARGGTEGGGESERVSGGVSGGERGGGGDGGDSGGGAVDGDGENGGGGLGGLGEEGGVDGAGNGCPSPKQATPSQRSQCFRLNMQNLSLLPSWTMDVALPASHHGSINAPGQPHALT